MFQLCGLPGLLMLSNPACAIASFKSLIFRVKTFINLKLGKKNFYPYLMKKKCVSKSVFVIKVHSVGEWLKRCNNGECSQYGRSSKHSFHFVVFLKKLYHFLLLGRFSSKLVISLNTKLKKNF